jgi:hypothetical protein
MDPNENKQALSLMHWLVAPAFIGSIGAVLQAQQVKGKEKGVWMFRCVPIYSSLPCHAIDPIFIPSNSTTNTPRVQHTATSPSASSPASWSPRAFSRG